MKTMYRAVPFAQETQLTQAVNNVETRFYVDDVSVFGNVPGVLSLWEGTEIGESVIMIAKGTGFIDVQRGTAECSGIPRAWVTGTKIAALIDAGQINTLQDNVTALAGKQTAHEGDTNNPHGVTTDQIGAVSEEAFIMYSEYHNGIASAHKTLFSKTQNRIDAEGVLKGNGNGGVTAAVPNTDYVPPSALDKYALKNATIVNISKPINLNLIYHNAILVCTNSSNITVTIPHSSSVDFPVGTVITFIRSGSGAVAFEVQNPLTMDLRSVAQGEPIIDKQHTAVSLVKIDTNTWYLLGAIV